MPERQRKIRDLKEQERKFLPTQKGFDVDISILCG